MRPLVVLLALIGEITAAQSNPYALRLEQAWKLVEERYYQTDYNGHDWAAIGQEYRAKLSGVKDWDALYALLDEMYERLEDNHSRVLSPELARLYLSGGQCQALPFRDSDLNVPSAEPPPAESSPKPVSGPTSTPNRPDTGKNGSVSPGERKPTPKVYPAPQVSLNSGVVVFRLSNLIDDDGLTALQDAVQRYNSKAKGYVLDLRGNPGGLALRMAEVAGVFMTGVPWRVVSRGVFPTPLPTIPPPLAGKPRTTRPLVVLIDGKVNSAAEGLAGALKDAKRAYLIGTKTAGNTEALTPYCFPDGGVALVANGVLAPFIGPTWEGRGVEPDLVEADPKKQLEAAIRYLLKKP
ncbi:MAG: peptidase S41 [Meiothermus sp.]